MFTKKSFYASLTILSIFFAVQLEGAIYEICNNNPIGTIQEMKVGDCNSSPCELKRNNEYNVSVTVNPGAYSTLLNSTSILTYMLLGMDFSSNDPNGCAALTGGACPAEANASLTFSFKYTIPGDMPLGNYKIKYQLYNQGPANLICYTFLFKVTQF